jgi:hypothetical protein
MENNSMKKKAIVITSINNPSEAVLALSKIEGYKLYVIGDKKTPKNWECENVEYISFENQIQLNYSLIKELPFNHYGRKMIGYIMAIKNGYDVIVDTDDDNIPYNKLEFPSFNGEFKTSPKNLRFINIYKSFTDKHIWPRGFPLNDILNPSSNQNLHDCSKFSFAEVGIWQGLADGDTDVDAIYRLTSNRECIFDKLDPVVLNDYTMSPFNSQNTAFRKECFPLLYLPSYVNFRFTDILRGLIAQPILWSAGYKLGFTQATVYQKRNIHNYMDDFISEIPCFLNSERIVEIADKSITKTKSISDNLFNTYMELEKENIVKIDELKLLECWLRDIE